MARRAGWIVMFAGEATLAQARLQNIGPERDLPGDLYVTAEAIVNPEFAAPDSQPTRWFCIMYGPANPRHLASIFGPVPEGWDPSVLP